MSDASAKANPLAVDIHETAGAVPDLRVDGRGRVQGTEDRALAAQVQTSVDHLALEPRARLAELQPQAVVPARNAAWRARFPSAVLLRDLHVREALVHERKRRLIHRLRAVRDDLETREIP